MNKRMKIATLVFAVFLVSMVALAWASPAIYEWLSAEFTIEEDLTISGEIAGELRVGHTINVTATITNPTALPVDGTLTVAIYDINDMTTPIETLFSASVTVPATEYFVGVYPWTASLGTYKASATFTTS